jgi:hypothetical protein
MDDDKTKYMVMSQDQNAGRIHHIKIDNNSCESVEQFKYTGTTTNQDSIQHEIKRRMKSVNVCYYSVQIFFSYSLLSKNINQKIHRTIICLYFVWVSNLVANIERGK